MTGVRELRADALMAISVLLLGSFLSIAGVGLLAQWEVSAARRQSLSVDDLLGAVAVASGLGIVAWWVLSGMFAVAAAVLTRCGRLQAAERAGKCSPAFMRRLALAALSVQLLAAPTAQAAVPPGGPAWVTTQEVAVQAQWSPTPLLAVEDATGRLPKTPNAATLPKSPAANAPKAPAAEVPDAHESTHGTQTPIMEPGATGMSARGPQAATTQTATTHAGEPQAAGPGAGVTATPETSAPAAAATLAPQPAVRPHWQPSAPVPDPGLLASKPVRAARDAPPARQVVAVLAGDTLWEIAARHLGPSASDVEVALHWPRWYEANKAEIGESPHVLLPGQILKAPATA